MKFLTLIAMSLISFHTYANGLSSVGEGVATVVNPPKNNETFVPPSFDDMDESEITYVNHSRSSCFLKTYSLPPQIDKVNKVIKISNISLILKADYCLYRDISTPTTLKLGELPAGQYKLQFETQKGEFETYSEFNISKSKSNQKDDFEYAALDVNELTVKVDKLAKKIDLTLPGNFPNGCYRFKEVKVIQTNSPTVIEVLPIVEVFTNVCTQDIKFYSKKVSIPYSVDSSMKKLIHIRSADGTAINRIVTLE